MSMRDNAIGFRTHPDVRTVEQAFGELAVTARTGVGRVIGGVEFGLRRRETTPSTCLTADRTSPFTHTAPEPDSASSAATVHLYVFDRGWLP